ncbi:hypothetical protein V6N12_071095 [Hibiscus sabdariffa]|uniref:Uncharacterized protein n=1 Tax=Hibiscus sabdariffa TaxID=183260 RepID=A0ABR2FIT2_9ROSI
MTPGTNEATDSRQGKRTKEAKKAAGQDTHGGGDGADINEHIKLQSLIEKVMIRGRIKSYRTTQPYCHQFVPALESQGNATEGEMRDDKHVAYAAHDQTP